MALPTYTWLIKNGISVPEGTVIVEMADSDLAIFKAAAGPVSPVAPVAPVAPVEPVAPCGPWGPGIGLEQQHGQQQHFGQEFVDI